MNSDFFTGVMKNSPEFLGSEITHRITVPGVTVFLIPAGGKVGNPVRIHPDNDRWYLPRGKSKMFDIERIGSKCSTQSVAAMLFLFDA